MSKQYPKCIDLALVVKLGSLVVHAQEMTGPRKHVFDVSAMEVLANDPEVVEWLGTIDKALLPVKR